MILDDLTFGIFQEIEPNIIEIIANEGIELSGRHIEQLEEGLLEKFDKPYALLINRKNSYSHTHTSMLKVAKLKNLAAVAILVYSDMSIHTAKLHQAFQDNVSVFEDKNNAIAWLRESIRESG